MNELEYRRELSAFDEKIALADLEATKAEERVDELKYQKARFVLDVNMAMLKAVKEEQQKKEQKPNAG